MNPYWRYDDQVEERPSIFDCHAAKIILVLMLLAGIGLLCAGCSGGFHPLQDAPAPLPVPKTPYYDATTPASYLASTKHGWSSGILDEIILDGKEVFVITTARAKREAAGNPQPYTDKYGNHVFVLDVGVISAEEKAKQDAGTKRLEGK